MTGRYAAPELIEIADTVTEMTKVKHAMDAGHRGPQGHRVLTGARARRPRIVVAGTHSGVGKTTVATGLMAALRRAGHRVGAAKVGPDFIDPGYHALAVGPAVAQPRPLDVRRRRHRAAGRRGPATAPTCSSSRGSWASSTAPADGTPSSTADVAALLDAPVVLVVDAASP